MQVNDYIDFNGKKLIIKRTFKEHNLKPNFDVNVMKERTRSDTLLKRGGILYCCETIQDVEIISLND